MKNSFLLLIYYFHVRMRRLQKKKDFKLALKSKITVIS